MFIRGPAQSRVYLLGFYPTPEGWREAPENSFRALSIVYGCHAQLIDEPAEAMNLSSLPIISLEIPSASTQPLDGFVHPERCVYVVGNSKYPAPAHALGRVDHRVHVPVPPDPRRDLERTLYGFQILPIVLNHRYIQCSDTPTSK